MTAMEIEHLKTSITIAWRAREKGNHLFGAELVDEHDQILLQAENTVVTGRDVTGHAETNLVRLATLQFSPEQLSHCIQAPNHAPCALGRFIGVRLAGWSMRSAKWICMA